MTAHGDILFDVREGVARVTLNRPKALNAVSLEMLHQLEARLEEWAEDGGVAAVVIGGEGRAFAAGGDIRRLYDAGRAGDREEGDGDGEAVDAHPLGVGDRVALDQLEDARGGEPE